MWKDHTFVALEEILQTLREDAASGMEQLQQAASDVEAKLDRQIQLHSKLDGEVEHAITRKAEEFQDQVARRRGVASPNPGVGSSSSKK